MLPPQINNLRLPIIGAPMFLASGPDLVLAQCKAGLVGAFPALNARPQEELDRWLSRIKNELALYREQHPDVKVGPYAVNLIVNATNTRLDNDLDTCVQHRVPIIITSLSVPTRVVERIHSYGGIVLHDVIKLRHAQKALESNVDGLILVCSGAGGHTGVMNPFALVNEIRRFFGGPLALSGAITNGSGLLAAQAMGCDFAYMGTRFIATRESLASRDYKEMIVSSHAGGIVCTPLFSGVHANYLADSIRNAGLDPDNLQVSKMPKRYTRRADGPAPWRQIWGAGQGVGNIDDIPSVAELVDRMEREYRDAISNLRMRTQ